MTKYLRFVGILFLSVVIILSLTIGGTKLTNPATFSHTIEVLDTNRSNVLLLSASSAVSSAAISALPTDICSPIAEQLSEFSTWFLLILSIIYLEKYLLTIFGAVSCYVLIPLGCSLLLVCFFFPSERRKIMGAKLLALGLSLILVIPTSVWISDQIHDIYAKSIELTIESANAISENLTENSLDENDEESSILGKASSILDELSGSATNIIKQFKNIINRFIEATAIMIVTSCLIPLLVILFFTWLIKALFGFQIVFPEKMLPPTRKHHHMHSSNDDEEPTD